MSSASRLLVHTLHWAQHQERVAASGGGVRKHPPVISRAVTKGCCCLVRTDQRPRQCWAHKDSLYAIHIPIHMRVVPIVERELGQTWVLQCVTGDIIRIQFLINMQATESALLISSLGSKMRGGYLNTTGPIFPPGCAYHIMECRVQAHVKPTVHCCRRKKKALDKTNKRGPTRAARVWRQRPSPAAPAGFIDGK